MTYYWPVASIGELVVHGAPARYVSTRQNGPRPETRRRDHLGRDRDAQVWDRSETVSRPRRRSRDHIKGYVLR